MMELLQLLILGVAVPTFFAYICRLAMLSFRIHSPVIVTLHVAFAISVGWSAYHATLGQASMGEGAAVIAAACWILLSIKTWREGVPHHHETRPMDLDPMTFSNIPGGRK